MSDFETHRAEAALQRRRDRLRDAAFRNGDRVEKLRGYRFPGVVVSLFWTLAGETRYVVEADDPDFAGMLHIFSEEQLIRRARA